MDIKIKSEEGNFKFRVAGLLEHDGRYLAVKIGDNSFYCLPGGHVEIGESTDVAILREMEEELGFPVKIKRLIAIAQNFYGKGDKNFHELSYYYVVNPVNESDVNTDDYERIENDKGVMKRLEFKWLTKADFEICKFNPSFVKDILDSENVFSVINYDNGECKILKL